VGAGGHRLACGPPFAARVLELAGQFLLLVSTLITGSPLSWWVLACSLM